MGLEIVFQPLSGRALGSIATRALEIISEASRRLPADMKERHAHIPWAEMARAGNVYRHESEDVEHRVVWGTVHNRFPALVAMVELELQQLDAAP